MLILGQKKEPQRIVLREAVPPAPAVRKGRKIVAPATDGEPEAYVVMAPITRAMKRRAHRAAAALLGDTANIADVDIDRLIDAGEKGATELIRLGVIEWGGLGDKDGHALALTPDAETRFATANDPQRPSGTIDLLLADDALIERIEAEYVRPEAARTAEKNGLSASPNGTGEAGTQERGTASSPANRRTKRAVAAAARTASTRSRRKPAKAPGKR